MLTCSWVPLLVPLRTHLPHSSANCRSCGVQALHCLMHQTCFWWVSHCLSVICFKIKSELALSPLWNLSLQYSIFTVISILFYNWTWAAETTRNFPPDFSGSSSAYLPTVSTFENEMITTSFIMIPALILVFHIPVLIKKFYRFCTHHIWPGLNPMCSTNNCTTQKRKYASNTNISNSKALDNNRSKPSINCSASCACEWKGAQKVQFAFNVLAVSSNFRWNKKPQTH